MSTPGYVDPFDLPADDYLAILAHVLRYYAPNIVFHDFWCQVAITVLLQEIDFVSGMPGWLSCPDDK